MLHCFIWKANWLLLNQINYLDVMEVFWEHKRWMEFPDFCCCSGLGGQSVARSKHKWNSTFFPSIWLFQWVAPSQSGAGGTRPGRVRVIDRRDLAGDPALSLTLISTLQLCSSVSINLLLCTAETGIVKYLIMKNNEDIQDRKKPSIKHWPRDPVPYQSGRF